MYGYNAIGTVQRQNGIEYTKTSIVQVRKAIKETGSWSGLLVPNKVNSFHFEGGWQLGHRYEFDSLDNLENHINSMMFYMEPELGDRVAFYLINE